MTDDWTDVLAALLDAGARFLVIGAHALAGVAGREVHAGGIGSKSQSRETWSSVPGISQRRRLAGIGPFAGKAS